MSVDSIQSRFNHIQDLIMGGFQDKFTDLLGGGSPKVDSSAASARNSSTGKAGANDSDRLLLAKHIQGLGQQANVVC